MVHFFLFKNRGTELNSTDCSYKIMSYRERRPNCQYIGHQKYLNTTDEMEYLVIFTGGKNIYEFKCSCHLYDKLISKSWWNIWFFNGNLKDLIKAAKMLEILIFSHQICLRKKKYVYNTWNFKSWWKWE